MPNFANFRILVDTPSSIPALNFGAYAMALAHAITNSRPQFAVAIYGPWGSGKTTLMNAVKSNLRTANIVIVDFSAWRYEREQFLLVPLLDTIREALVDWADAREQEFPAGDEKSNKLAKAARTAAAFVGKLATSIVAGISFSVGAPGSIELSFEAAKALERAREFDKEAAQQAATPGATRTQRLINERGSATFPQSIYHTCFRELRRVFTDLRREFTDLRTNEGDLRFVVFVDDLDRCLPAGALEVLEAIKLFFEHEGFVFVVGLDRGVVERFVEQSYPDTLARDVSRPVPVNDAARAATPASGAAFLPTPDANGRRSLISGSEYLKKIFQVPFTLAPVQLSQLDDLIGAIELGGELQKEQVDDLRNCVVPHLRVALSEVAVNPREVKRFINSYVLQMKIKQHLKPDMVLALQTINARPDWVRVRESLEVYRDEFVRALREELAPAPAAPGAAGGGSSGLIELLDPQLRVLPQSFVEYVDPQNGAGRVLLDPQEEGRIDEYLYSVESTGSSHGSVLLDMLPLLSRAKRELNSLENKASQDIATSCSRAESLLRNARTMIGNLESLVAIKPLSLQLEALADSMSPPTGSGFDNADTKHYADSKQAEIDAVIRRVRALRRQDNLSAPSA